MNLIWYVELIETEYSNSVSSSPGSDVACLFAKRSSKLRAPSEIARTQKQRVCARAYKLRLHAYVTARK